MVCKVFFAKKLSEKGRKSGNKLSGMLFASAMPCKCRQSTEKGRHTHYGKRKSCNSVSCLPNWEQKDLLQQTFGCVRLLYNETLTIHKGSTKLE